MKDCPIIRQVAVLGAGVMGAQIAAHFANQNIPVLLYDLPSDGDAYAFVKGAIKNLAKLKPAPFSTSLTQKLITPCHYDADLERLKSCDLVIEAIVERFDLKKALFHKIAPHLKKDVILGSNTSGLSVQELASTLPEQLQARFLVVHFFNPPRYMKLVELVPHEGTAAEVTDGLESFLTSRLGKGIVRGKDTPNFIANRIGVFSMLNTLYHAKELGIPYEVVDALTGTLIGRAKSATYRTIDVVGIDTLVHVIKTMKDGLPHDAFNAFYETPEVIAQLVKNGSIGQKAGRGFYQKQGKDILVLADDGISYREAEKKPAAQVIEALKEKTWEKRFDKLLALESPESEFIWRCFRDLFIYSATHLESIADNARDVDQAMRWGFGWSEGPFEIWQQIGWQKVVRGLQDALETGDLGYHVALPQWVSDIEAVATKSGAYSPKKAAFVESSRLAVYDKQWVKESYLGEEAPEGETLFETDGVKLWQLEKSIGILSFKSKLGSMGAPVLAGIREAILYAEEHLDGLVIWQPGPYFSVGADLKVLNELIDKEAFDEIDSYIKEFQKTTMAVKHAAVPVVAAVKNYALGGGAELMLHCSRAVLHQETYAGLVELGVGVIPAGGGCKELLRRASLQTDKQYGFNTLMNAFSLVAMGKVSSSARELQSWGFLQESDVIVSHVDELLFVAHQEAKALAARGYQAPASQAYEVFGEAALGNMLSLLANYKAGGFISDYDHELAVALANVMSGGDLSEGTFVSDDWALQLEREFFGKLCKNSKTKDRIDHMLKTGKPLRN